MFGPVMRPRLVVVSGMAVALGLLGLWAFGGFDGLAVWAAEGQREAQNALAQALRQLRAGEPGALSALIGVAFAYGVFHAAGPGHGKVLIGGYGVARRVRAGPLIGIALASSLAQATTAVLLVYAGILVLDLTREAMVGITEDVFAPLSYAAIGLIGLWLVVRGARRLWRGRDHGTSGHVHDDGCGHAHVPTSDQVAQVTSWREAAILTLSVALRPCTGAMFLLILCWRLGVDAVGIAGAYAMGLGTALITVTVAFLSVWAREGAIATLTGAAMARMLPLIEIGAGLVVAILSAEMLRVALI